MRYPALYVFALLLSGTALAAPPPTALAPAETFAVLGFRTGAPDDGTTQALTDDLETLGWEQAGRTLERLGAFSDDPVTSRMLEMYGQMFQGEQGNMDASDGSRFERCLERQQETVTWTDDQTPATEGGLITVSASAYNPVPAVTALLRATPAAEPMFTELHRALVRCTERTGNEVARLREGNTTIFVLGNAGDFPVAVSRRGRLFVAGTNPEAVRGVLRRAGGSDEANFAETPLYRNNEELLTRPGLHLALDAGALAGTLESLSGSLTDAQTAPLADRLVRALRTLGTYAGTLGVGDGEVRLESQLTVNPGGGDRELAALLLRDAPAPDPRFAPRSAYSVGAANVPVGPLFAYLDGWARLAGEASGRPLGLRRLARDAGLDLDVALLDWLGNELESAVLEPLGTDLTPYLYGQAQVFTVRTRGEAATRAGLAEIGRFVTRLVRKGVLGDVGGMEDTLFEPATEQTTFGGVQIERTRFGPNLDVGVAFLDDTLLVGTPAAALESAISTARGDTRSVADDADFGEARAEMPAGVTRLSYTDVSGQLRGLGELAELASQPLAFAAQAGLSELGSGEAEGVSFADLLHLTDLLPETLFVFAEHTGALSSYTYIDGDQQRSVSRLELR